MAFGKQWISTEMDADGDRCQMYRVSISLFSNKKKCLKFTLHFLSYQLNLIFFYLISFHYSALWTHGCNCVFIKRGDSVCLIKCIPPTDPVTMMHTQLCASLPTNSAPAARRLSEGRGGALQFCILIKKFKWGRWGWGRRVSARARWRG